jgi:sugar lactone lactonase YvrE
VAISWGGDHLIVADRLSRKVFRVDPASEQETLMMDPNSLDFGNYDRSLLVVDAVIGDIAWHDGLLYLAVQAGYSSAIYGIDTGNQRVISHRLAPGPKPSGLDFDPVDGSLYTIDFRNRELRRFSTADKEDVAEIPSEWAEPRGLSFDSNRGLWSMDWSTGDVLKLKVED